MGKKQPREPATINDPITFPIRKNKTFHQNLDLFLKMICAKFSQLSTRQYLSYVHKYIARCRLKFSSQDQKQVVKTLQRIKICKACDQWVRKIEKTIQCMYCDDYYHVGCVEGDASDEWCCLECDKLFRAKESPRKSLKARSSAKFNCAKCADVKTANKFSDNQTLIFCLKCDERFHKQCFGKKNTIVCYQCHQSIEETIKEKQMKQSTLLEHGFQKTSSKKKYKHERQREQNSFKDLKKEEDESTVATVTTSFGQKQFKVQFPQMTTEQIASYKKQLLYAIYSKKMEYTQTLQPVNCDLDDDSENSLDFQLMPLCPQDLKLYQKYKEQPIGPFHMVYREKMGYDVVAAKSLPKGMIVCEYIGDVVTLRQALRSNNDSLMEYKVGRNADETLFIRPEKYTNIARFINGINNKNGKSKANVKSFRAMIRGRPAVILSTSQPVKEGQSLAYDYNAGEKNTYPTDNFV